MTNKRKIINDPVYGFLSIDEDIIFDVISHPFFQRQRHIKQLGFTYLVYPGAVHSRFSHMLGALNLTKRAIDVLRSKGVEISHEESVGVQLAILLHDIGHGPFSHTSERALCNVHHETLTLMFMQRLNEEFHGQLDMAIAVFTDSYPRHFLHQLVSSQLDMDRLDYLGRDSFFTGVSEGIVGTERIINMLNVKDDTLVVDEKGIYSIEKFIISRRLMYWQVYLHKTVIAADNVFYSILRRARHLIKSGVSLAGAESFLYFLTNEVNETHFRNDERLLQLFAEMDDNDVISTIKGWIRHPDPILSTLCYNLINRRLPAVKVSQEPFTTQAIKCAGRFPRPDIKQSSNQAIKCAGRFPRPDINQSSNQAIYFVTSGQLVNHAYSFDDSEIKILYKNGECKGISEASDQLDRHFLEKEVKKYFLCYPKRIVNCEF